MNYGHMLADYEAWQAKRQQANIGAANVVLSATDGRPDEIASDLNTAHTFEEISGGQS